MTVSPVALEKPQTLSPDDEARLALALNPLGLAPIGVRGKTLILKIVNESATADGELSKRVAKAVRESDAGIVRDIDSITFS